MIAGSLSRQRCSEVHCHLSQNIHIQEILEKFWTVKDLPKLSPIISEEEEAFEKIFVETTKRLENGQFIVKIPLVESPFILSDSREYTLTRFSALEKRLAKNPKLKVMYVDLIEKYKALGHMSETSEVHDVLYFLSHHGVLNESSSTTKLRVVFNGSAPTDSSISFNDLQYAEPNIQDDIISILFRFRLYNVVVCADVAKMYRMILVDENQRSL